ncbi:hypothetical protein [Pseudomonas pergaminensis]
MYLGFELEGFKSLDTVTRQEVDNYKANSGKLNISKLTNAIVAQLGGKDVLGAREISQILFPTGQAHIFLSHSHGDEENAIKFAVAMERRGVEVFIDSCVWGSVDELLDAVNEQYSESEIVGDQKYYSHRKCDEAAAAAYVILMTELHRMIDQAECFLFLNTSKSVPLRSAGRNQTLSPWIYSELSFSAQVRSRVPRRDRLPKSKRFFADEMSMKEASYSPKSASFGFDIPTEHLPKISGKELKDHFERVSHRGGFYLDSLYYAYGLEDEFSERSDESA